VCCFVLLNRYWGIVTVPVIRGVGGDEKKHDRRWRKFVVKQFYAHGGMGIEVVSGLAYVTPYESRSVYRVKKERYNDGLSDEEGKIVYCFYKPTPADKEKVCVFVHCIIPGVNRCRATTAMPACAHTCLCSCMGVSICKQIVMCRRDPFSRPSINTQFLPTCFQSLEPRINRQPTA